VLVTLSKLIILEIFLTHTICLTIAKIQGRLLWLKTEVANTMMFEAVTGKMIIGREVLLFNNQLTFIQVTCD